MRDRETLRFLAHWLFDEVGMIFSRINHNCLQDGLAFVSSVQLKYFRVPNVVALAKDLP